MRLDVLSDLRFTCRHCTRCCRDWHVELLEGEADRIANLSWPAGDPLADRPVIVRRGGRDWLAHQVDGACVFLDSQARLCRIHAQFGPAAKPVGCQLFPFVLARTFGSRVSASLRWDCPTVQAGDGDVVRADALRSLVDVTPMDDSFGRDLRRDFAAEQVEMVVELLTLLLPSLESEAQRSLVLVRLCDWMAAARPGDMDRATLATGWLALRDQTALDLQADGSPSVIRADRLAYRALLALYLRRDEDVLHGRAGRWGRLTAMARACAGGGSPQDLGAEHPATPWAVARLFEGLPAGDAAAWVPLGRWMKQRLASLQFMGRCNHGLDWLAGLRSLALMYPLVLGVARVHAVAAGRTPDTLAEPDVRKAVAAVDHAFGRSPLLRVRMARQMAARLLHADVLAAVLRKL